MPLTWRFHRRTPASWPKEYAASASLPKPARGSSASRCSDMAGGLNVASDLLGGQTLYTSMYENPEALECLLDKIQQLFLATIDLQIEAAGGQERITNTDFPEYWFPEGRKGMSPTTSARTSRRPAINDSAGRFTIWCSSDTAAADCTTAGQTRAWKAI